MQRHMPIGYKLRDGKIQVDGPKAAVIKTVFASYLSGKSTNQIAKQLTEMGFLNANGKPSWNHGSVGKILENVKYLGDEFYPQLIDPGWFEQVQSRRRASNERLGRFTQTNSMKHQSTFGGLLRCGQCGEVYRRYSERNSRKAEQYLWKCKRYLYKNRVSCHCGFLTDEQIETAFVTVANRIMSRIPILDQKIPKDPIPYNREFHRLDRRIRELETEGRYASPELPVLLFERAIACYQTAGIDDRDYQTGKLKQAFSGRQPLRAFDRELFLKAVKQVTVYADQRLVFELISGLTLEAGY